MVNANRVSYEPPSKKEAEIDSEPLFKKTTFGQTNPFFQHDTQELTNLIEAFDILMWRIIDRITIWTLLIQQTTVSDLSNF